MSVQLAEDQVGAPECIQPTSRLQLAILLRNKTHFVLFSAPADWMEQLLQLRSGPLERQLCDLKMLLLALMVTACAAGSGWAQDADASAVNRADANITASASPPLPSFSPELVNSRLQRQCLSDGWATRARCMAGGWQVQAGNSRRVCPAPYP